MHLPVGTEALVGQGTFGLPDGAQMSMDGEGTPYAMRTCGRAQAIVTRQNGVPMVLSSESVTFRSRWSSWTS